MMIRNHQYSVGLEVDSYMLFGRMVAKSGVRWCDTICCGKSSGNYGNFAINLQLLLQDRSNYKNEEAADHVIDGCRLAL